MNVKFLKEKNSPFNLANILSLSRIIFLIPLILFLVADNLFMVLFTLFLIFLSDILDGYFARKLDLSSKFGESLDTVIDGAWFTAFISLLLITKNGITGVTIVFFLSFLLLLASSQLVKKYKSIAGILWINKINGFSCYILIIGALFNINWLFHPSILFSTLFMITMSVSILYIKFSLIDKPNSIRLNNKL